MKKIAVREKLKQPARGYVNFIREQGVIGLAVGFILGGAIKEVISSIVTDLINPILGLFLGVVGDFNEAVFNIGSAQIAWGSFVATMIDFLIIAAVVYFAVKGLRLEKLDKKK